MALGSRISRITASMATVFPAPDTTRMPSTAPAGIVSDSLSTASTMPSSVRNETWRSRTSSSGVTASSANAHPRVEPGVQEIDQRVGHHHEEGGVQHAGHDHGKVEVLERVVRELPDPVQAED